MCANAAGRWLPETPRVPAEIAPPLRAAIRSCIVAESPWPLVLLGGAGLGKTCAALCLLDYAGGAYYTTDDLADLLGRAKRHELTWYSEGQGGKIPPEEVWKGIGRQPLVVLDELGCRETVSDHHYDCVKRMLDVRENRPLVVISNLPVSRLLTLYDQRVTSRLSAGTLLDVRGRDRRLPAPSHGD